MNEWVLKENSWGYMIFENRSWVSPSNLIRQPMLRTDRTTLGRGKQMNPYLNLRPSDCKNTFYISFLQENHGCRPGQYQRSHLYGNIQEEPAKEAKKKENTWGTFCTDHVHVMMFTFDGATVSAPCTPCDTSASLLLYCLQKTSLVIKN